MTTSKIHGQDSYLSDDEVASLLGLSVSRLRNKISAGQPLPPYILPAGCRKRLWPYRKVHDWLAAFMVGGDGRALDASTQAGANRLRQSVRKARVRL